MRFMLLFKPDTEPDPGEHACKQDLPEMARLMGELRDRGVLVATEGLLPDDAVRVRLSAGRRTVTDGPFAETKELVAGFAVVELPTRAEAVELAERFLRIAGGGEAEVRRVQERAA